ncbi:iron ABC transporter permease [Roseomonas sp. OT10]|uniref:FecCD family ABC transporter permease n=1 Tax=Roseomonas cutis TaxID=2897332 RepID=UPI001E5166F5|nr:iron ABC transporter permease [Roseomonas sp. OT10]UFN49912.1 iron ABC transporter permease [Roseomonas sp. OT10]
MSAARLTPPRARATLIAAVLLVASLLAAVLFGPAHVSAAGLLAVLRDLLGLGALPAEHARDAAVLNVVRAPRAVVGALVGAGLGCAGAVLQGLFRNPLADPALIGVSSGAALFAVGGIVLGHGLVGLAGGAFGLWLLPGLAFLGGLAATLLIARLATRGGAVGVGTLLLAGIGVNALCAAGLGLFIAIADDRQARDINFWMLGSLAGARWPQVPVLLVLVLGPCLGMLGLARPLNALMLGEREAFHLGVSVERAKRAAILLAALAVAAAVAFSGMIGFVGLVVPHLVRMTVGPDHRVVLPCAALLGAALLVAADLVARSLVAPSELPIGVITGLVGAPFFLWLLRHRRVGP